MTEGFLKESPQDSVTGWPWGHLKEEGEGGCWRPGGMAEVGRGRTELGIWTLLWHSVEPGTGSGGRGGRASCGFPHRQVCPF